MRQAGVLAAAGLYALDHNVDRLAEDHARARALATALADCPRVSVDPATVETNIVLAALRRDEPAQGVVDELAAAGVLCGALDRRTLRFVTHLDIDDEALASGGGDRRPRANLSPMRAEIHPTYEAAHVRCSCGNEFMTRATKREIHVEICSECHPFYTGKQKLMDSGGRVERFRQRQAARRRPRRPGSRRSRRNHVTKLIAA